MRAAGVRDALAAGEAGLCSGHTKYRREKNIVFSDSGCEVSKCVPPIWGFVLSQLRIVEQEMRCSHTVSHHVYV